MKPIVAFIEFILKQLFKRLFFLLLPLCIKFVVALFRYNPREYYEKNPELKQCIDEIASGFFSPEDPQLFRDLANSLLNHDR
jgi:starch phosphorylase